MFSERRLLKVGGEEAGAGTGATGAALFLRLLRGWSSSGFLAALPLIFALARGGAAYYTIIDPSEMRCFNQVLFVKRVRCCSSVADPRSGAFFTPGSGIRVGKKIWIRDEHPRSFFQELRNSF